jgi:DNA-binding transcriptional ArsR family regulator
VTGRYSRVYWSIIDDDRFATVWGDDRALACWMRLLIAADMAWPSSALLPAGTNSRALKALVDAGLVDQVERPGRYRIHGLDAERKRRSEASQSAARARWDAPAMRTHSGRSAEVMLGRAEESKEEKSREEQDNDPVDAYYRLTLAWPSDKVTDWLERLAADHGAERVIARLGVDWKLDMNRADLLSRVETALKKEAHDRAKEAKRRQAQRERDDQQMIETMSEEQRAENLKRLRDAMAESGLLGGG